MDREELQRLATKHKLSGREFEVGYVSLSNGRRGLFCKRSSNSNPDQFYLCNDYAKLDETRLDYRGRRAAPTETTTAPRSRRPPRADSPPPARAPRA